MYYTAAYISAIFFPKLKLQYTVLYKNAHDYLKKKKRQMLM